jgi:hypothetical protein
VDVSINNEPGLLFDLSVAGCQLVSRAAVKPNQVLRVTLPDKDQQITCTGKVMWARLEPSAAGRPVGYRAGVKFTRPDETAIQEFIAGQGTT